MTAARPSRFRDMNMAWPDTITAYRSRVMHRRHMAPSYRFVYRVFEVLLDVEVLDSPRRVSRLFAVGRRAPVAVHRRDHGHENDTPLRPWVEALLQHHGLEPDGGRIRLLCMPRILGHVFNPINLYYCQHAGADTLRAVVAEVRNTFGEKHCYVLHDDGRPMSDARVYTKIKRFHVSPLLDVRGEYRFRLALPDEQMRVLIDEFDGDQAVMTATLSGRRLTANAADNGRPATAVPSDRQWLDLLLGMPLMTLKVVAAIHWQALKIWMRGAAYRSKPAPPAEESS